MSIMCAFEFHVLKTVKNPSVINFKKFQSSQTSNTLYNHSLESQKSVINTQFLQNITF